MRYCVVEYLVQHRLLVFYCLGGVPLLFHAQDQPGHVRRSDLVDLRVSVFVDGSFQRLLVALLRLRAYRLPFLRLPSVRYILKRRDDGSGASVFKSDLPCVQRFRVFPVVFLPAALEIEQIPVLVVGK